MKDKQIFTIIINIPFQKISVMNLVTQTQRMQLHNSLTYKKQSLKQATQQFNSNSSSQLKQVLLITNQPNA